MEFHVFFREYMEHVKKLHIQLLQPDSATIDYSLHPETTGQTQGWEPKSPASPVLQSGFFTR